MTAEYIIARYGEISLKGGNRPEFERLLVKNMRRVVEDLPGVRIERTSGRILIEVVDAKVEHVTARLARVFGILSVSPVIVASLSVESIREAAVKVMERFRGTAAGRTFKVEVKRPNKRFLMDSPTLASVLGGDLLQHFPMFQVDVHRPELTVYVEVRDGEAFVYGEKIPAVGGLPVGMSGRVGLLLSGGIDSPVAGWLSMKRGVELEAIHFHSFPFTSERALQKVEQLAQILADWGGRVRLHTVHFTDVQTEIRKNCPDELGITIMRRMMLRIAEDIARERRLLALVTGESLGQVASQTLESMRTINAVTSLPILRPLVAEDKIDIIRRARQIGTYDTSILPYEDCCTLFVPKNPRTKPRLDEAELAESKLSVPELVQGAVSRTTTKTFHARI